LAGRACLYQDDITMILSGSQKIYTQMDVPHQFQKVGFLLADNGLVAVLKQVAGALVSEVEIDRIPSEQSAHEQAQLCFHGLNQQVKMVWDQGPGEALGAGLFKHGS